MYGDLESLAEKTTTMVSKGEEGKSERPVCQKEGAWPWLGGLRRLCLIRLANILFIILLANFFRRFHCDRSAAYRVVNWRQFDLCMDAFCYGMRFVESWFSLVAADLVFGHGLAPITI